jgi:glycosyltransferase involved in cell wall biosynthesis
LKLSIITPSFNQGRFLADCVESVLAQVGTPKERRSMSADADGVSQHDDSAHASMLPSTKGDHVSPLLAGRSCIAPHCFEVEHIVIDAGSTDETLDVLKRYPHLKWTSEPDKGMSDGINKGFLRATGDWVMWLNCDDYLLPGALAKVAECARQHPDAAVIHGDCVFVNEDKSPIRRKHDTPVDEWDFLFVGCCIPSTATFFRSDIIKAGHLLDVEYRNCMDWEYYLRLTRLRYKFQYLPEALAGFRWHDESTTQKHWQRMIDEGLRCQWEHITERGLPNALKNAPVLKALRKVFQVRRVLKRVAVHGRWW